MQTLKLDEGPLEIIGTYKPSNHPQNPGVLSLEPSSLQLPSTATCTAPPSSSSISTSACMVNGQIYCLNTVERMTTFDLQAATAQVTLNIWNDIHSGRALENPSLLQRMLALAYCDLKLYKYHYWLGFPVVPPSVPYTLRSMPQTSENYFSSEGEQVVQAVEDYYNSNARTASGSLFLLYIDDESSDKGGGRIECFPLTSWEHLSQKEEEKKKSGVFLVAADTSNTEDYPGWSLQNALLLAAVHFKVPVLRVLCLKTRKGRVSAQASVIFEVNLPSIPETYHPDIGNTSITPSSKALLRVADLGALMDPIRLAASAVDLNIELMRWRAAPTLDTAKIAQTRCLLLGAGTLGCSVARVLLGWGVRKITFVDSGRVAYSNPVRQSLFEFEDCLQGGKPKAVAAADAVKRIFPDVDATGVELTIPMPGHPPAVQIESEVQSVLESTEKLGTLIDEHDVVFMLLDTRESRWLGTLMCAGSGGGTSGGGEREKLAITAALGFESFVVMRHGASAPEKSSAKGMKKEEHQQERRLGCYFCSDVIAPANSTRDRTMDQQCTVARPGLSGIAGSLAVEVMAAVLQHPLGVAAPAAAVPAAVEMNPASNTSLDEENEESDEDLNASLGPVPHMIRGHLSGFSQTCLTGYAFEHCPACSRSVVEAFRSRGADFVLQAVSQPGYLEEVCGLSALQKEMKEMELLQKERDEEKETEGGGGGEEDEWEEL